jgi:hypothetical protein
MKLYIAVTVFIFAMKVVANTYFLCKENHKKPVVYSEGERIASIVAAIIVTIWGMAVI